MIHELRVYDAVPGRLADLNARFTNLTLPLFRKHGIGVVGFWEDLIGTNNRLTYILAYESMAHREQAWNAFKADPEWIAGAAETEKNGPLVARVTNTLMQPTSYSPMQ